MRVILAAPTVAMVMWLPVLVSVREVLRLKLDRLPVRRTVRRMVPGMLVARKRRGVRDTLLGDEPLERVEPMAVVGLAGVGVARTLRALDLGGERRGPLRPG